MPRLFTKSNTTKKENRAAHGWGAARFLFYHRAGDAARHVSTRHGGDLEPPHIQILINQDTLCQFQVELHGAFCFQLNHEQFFAAGEAWFIA